MRAIAWAFAALLALWAGVVLGQSPVWEQLWKSERATLQTSVVGRARTMMKEDGRERSAMAAVRAASGKVRLDYEAGRRRWSLIDDGQRLIRLDPRMRAAVVHRRPTLVIDRALAERNYVAREVGEALVAGRTARVIEIAPRETGPVARRLWLDRETAFALKRERYNVDGRLTSETEYTEVEFAVPVPSETFVVPEGWKVVGPDGEDARLDLGELSERMGFAVRAPRYIPPGFVSLGGYVQQRGRRDVRMAELRYTDGLRVLSVSQHEKERGGEGRGWFGRRGHGFGRGRGGARGGGRGRGPGVGPPGPDVMTLVDRGTEKALRYLGRDVVVVVVGDLPAEELVRIATSVD